MKRPLIDRFMEKVSPEPNTGCWLWAASLGGTGYGQISINNFPDRAHRISYQLHVGPIPEGLWVLHRCDEPTCVNPAHLFLGTHQDNVTDRENKRRGNQAWGDRHGKVKVADAELPKIFALRRAGYIKDPSAFGSHPGSGRAYEITDKGRAVAAEDDEHHFQRRLIPSLKDLGGSLNG